MDDLFFSFFVVSSAFGYIKNTDVQLWSTHKITKNLLQVWSMKSFLGKENVWSDENILRIEHFVSR